MSWIAPLRDTIVAEAAHLQQHGFSWIGEDEVSIRYTDGEVLVAFVAERYYSGWEVWVRHLGEAEPDAHYRLDLVMRVMDGATSADFAEQAPGDRQRLVARFVRYIIDNKQRLFGPTCSYARQYNEFDRLVAERAMAQWAAKPGTNKQ